MYFLPFSTFFLTSCWEISSGEVRVLCHGGTGGKSPLIGQEFKMADGKQPSDWTIIQDGGSPVIGQEFKMVDRKAAI